MKSSILFILALLLAARLPAGEAKAVELSWEGEARLRPELRLDADLDASEDDQRGFVLSRLRLKAEAKKGDVSLVLQAQDSRVFGEEASTVSNEANLDLHQGYLAVRDLFGAGSALELGRREWSYGGERLIGAFGWDNVGRAFDGARARFVPGDSRFDLFWARPQRFVEGSVETNQDLFGAYLSHPLSGGGAAEVYALGFRDGRELAGEQQGELGNTLLGAFGARLDGRWERIRGNLEVVYESGEWNGDSLRAFALGGELGLDFGTDTIVRPFVGFDYATGDEDPGDGERQEFFNFFPTNHPLYGYADYFGWRNLVSPSAGIEVKKGARRAIIKYYDFQLDEARGAWKSAGGVVLGSDPTGNSGRRVGSELDVAVWTPLGPDGLQLHGGWSEFWPGEFARATRGEDPSGFGYVQILWSFSTGPRN